MRLDPLRKLWGSKELETPLTHSVAILRNHVLRDNRQASVTSTHVNVDEVTQTPL